MPGICGPNAECNNTGGSFTCICNEGYAGDPQETPCEGTCPTRHNFTDVQMIKHGTGVAPIHSSNARNDYQSRVWSRRVVIIIGGGAVVYGIEPLTLDQVVTGSNPDR